MRIGDFVDTDTQYVLRDGVSATYLHSNTNKKVYCCA